MCLKHLAFYYAVGFGILGCLLLVAFSSTLVGVILGSFDPYVVTSLAAAMFLPFVIGALSWRDWKKVQKKEKQEFAQKLLVGIEEEETIPQKSGTRQSARPELPRHFLE
jgi:hypothetical protein